MRGLVLEAGRAEVRNDLPEPEPGPHETLVEVIVGGVCATDLALRAGYMGFAGVPGHEFVGWASSAARALVAGDGRLGLLCAHPLHEAGLLVTVAVEATGNADVLPKLLSWLAPRGTLVLKTTSETPIALDLAPLVVNEQRLIGSRCGRVRPALELLAQGRVPVERFIHGRSPLHSADRALEHAARPGVLKVLLEIGS